MRTWVTTLVATGLLLFANAAYADPHYYYGDDCREQNATAGTVIGAIVGGVIGSQIGKGSGNVAATIGGVILGGLAGNAIARDIDCRDRPYAFRAYSRGFDGPVGRRYAWYGEKRRNHGYFRTTREFHERGYVCRDFVDDRYIGRRHYVRRGTACREHDGNWHFR